MKEEFRIEELMRKYGYTPDLLAEQIGVTRHTLSKLMSGDSPTVMTLRKIADALGVPISSLFAESESFLAVVLNDDELLSFKTKEQFIEYALSLIKYPDEKEATE